MDSDKLPIALVLEWPPTSMFTWRLFPISGTVLASIAMAVNYIGSGGATVFTTLILMTGITVAIPYGFSALAQIKWRIVDNRAVHTPRFARDMIVAVLSLVFSILFIVYSRNTGHPFFTYWAPFFLAGAPFARHPATRFPPGAEVPVTDEIAGGPMTGAEHYRKAERLLESIWSTGSDGRLVISTGYPEVIAAAQVHAILTPAARTDGAGA